MKHLITLAIDFAMVRRSSALTQRRHQSVPANPDFPGAESRVAAEIP